MTAVECRLTHTVASAPSPTSRAGSWAAGRVTPRVSRYDAVVDQLWAHREEGQQGQCSPLDDDGGGQRTGTEPAGDEEDQTRGEEGQDSPGERDRGKAAGPVGPGEEDVEAPGVHRPRVPGGGPRERVGRRQSAQVEDQLAGPGLPEGVRLGQGAGTQCDDRRHCEPGEQPGAASPCQVHPMDGSNRRACATWGDAGHRGDSCVTRTDVRVSASVER